MEKSIRDLLKRKTQNLKEILAEFPPEKQIFGKKICWHGNEYRGDATEAGIPHGKGILITDDLVFRGTFREGLLDGKFRIRDRDNKITVTAVFHRCNAQGSRIVGEKEEVVMKTPEGIYYGPVDEELLPRGKGRFRSKDGIETKGVWEKAGLNGPFTAETVYGSALEGWFADRELNGFFQARFCNGDYLEGFMAGSTLDSLIRERCFLQKNPHCPDPCLEDLWEDFADRMKSEDAALGSRIELLYLRLCQELKTRTVRHGHLQFRIDGIYLRDYWHRNTHAALYSAYPYRLHSKREVKYLADRFYEEYHRFFPIMNDDGEENGFEWVSDYEEIERIVFLSGQGEDYE